MMRNRLTEAIQLREEGRAKQDKTILDKALTLLLDLGTVYPGDAEIIFQTGVAYDNLGMGREAIPYYERALDLGLAGSDLERCLLGLGSTYRALGYYQESENTLRRGMSEFPENRAIQVLLSLALYNMQKHKEAMELVLVNLMETTSDEKLQYFKRGILYYSQHLDETW